MNYPEIAMGLKSIIQKLDLLCERQPKAVKARELDQLRDELKRLEQKSLISWKDSSPYWEIFEHLNIPMCVVDNTGIVVYATSYYLALTAHSREQLVGSREPFQERVGEHVISERKPVYFGKTRTINGLQSSVYVSGLPIFDADNEVEHVIIMLHPTDNIKKMYHELTQSANRQESIRIMENGAKNGETSVRMLGNSWKIEEIRQQIRRVAPTDATVLITGESGCGKEVVADYVHSLSNRRDKPYVKINCAAIPPNLLEAELFGYERGAFTGANPKGKSGLLEIANTGTILLDEIGDFPLQLQPKLLRVIQQGEIFRVGGGSAIKLDVRIIAATNCNLREKLRAGSFREDLFYRLNVFPIIVPPLRERLSDIHLLIADFFQRYSDKYKKDLRMSPAMVKLLESYTWPGNIRELQNVIEYYVICSDEETEMRLDDLRQVLGRNGEIEESLGKGKGLYELRDGYERHLIEQALAGTSNASQAAQLLGIHPSSLTRKMAKYGLHGKDD